MTTRQYARLVAKWVGGIGLDPSLFGTHSLRRTKTTLIYRRAGNLRAVQLLLGHTKIESTFVTWASKLTMRLPYQNRLTSDELGRADMLCLLFFGATFNVRAASGQSSSIRARGEHVRSAAMIGPLGP
jgi:integrase